MRKVRIRIITKKLGHDDDRMRIVGCRLFVRLLVRSFVFFVCLFCVVVVFSTVLCRFVVEF